MSEAIANYETSHSTSRLFRRSPVDRSEITGRRRLALERAAHPSFRELKLGCASESEPLTFDADGGDRRTTARLLVIDDDSALIPEQLRRAFPSPSHQLRVACTAGAALEYVRSGSIDVIVLNLGLADQSGLEVYQAVRAIDARIPVIALTSVDRPSAAIEAMKHGAYDCLFKPLDPQQLRRIVDEALEVAHRVRRPTAEVPPGTDEDTDGTLIGACPAMSEVYKAIGRVAAQDVPVLITGESGTGKELVARAIHQHGSRANAPFLALNCAAIPEQLLESELFGHERGAFTGADRRRIGKFEQCTGGTIFLDEVGDMPPALQGKVLRLLQDQTFERVGGNETIRTDVRVIAATHRDLRAWSAEGRFRPDLYYRLGVFTVQLPPLRERGDDLSLLVQQFVRRYSRELGRDVSAVAPDTLERLRRYAWPGNVRELQSVLKQALLRARGPVLLAAFLPDSFDGVGATPPDASPVRLPALEAYVRERLSADTRNLYTEGHRAVDKILLPLVMEHTRGNQSQAAVVLGIARQTLRLRLLEAGLVEPTSRNADEESGSLSASASSGQKAINHW
jgi:two-component system nitrogen regulation response regulator GlnG